MSDLKDVRIIDKLDDDFEIDWGVEAINAPKLWKYTKGEGVKVAVIDTGLDMNHKDLSGKVVASLNMFDKSTRDVADKYGHGTHVAGLIAGDRTGVSPNVDLYIASSLNDKGLGSMASVLDGITFAINHKVDILCMSLGSPKPLPQILSERIRKAYNKGITVVCATGNDGKQSVHYPAHYEYVIGVGGVNEDLERASFSNYGFDMDIVAPSVDILSTYKDGSYAYMSGTSMASPLVTGGIALIKSYFRKNGVELSPMDIKFMLSKNRSKQDRFVGHGLIDLAKIAGLE